MISLQKAMRLGIAPEITNNPEEVKIIHVRDDCSPETISDVVRLYGDIKISEPLSNKKFDEIIQKIYKKKKISDY